MPHLKVPSAPKLTVQKLSQRNIAITLKFSVIALSVIIIYAQDLGMVFASALSDESSFHILAVPFLFVYLLFRKRRLIGATIKEPEAKTRGFKKYFSILLGVALFATSMLTYWYGSYTFTPLDYHMATLPLVVISMVLIFFSLDTLKQALFPVVFLIFLMPPPAEILYAIGAALSNLTAVVSNGLINLFGVETTLSSSYGSPLITLTRPDQTIMNFNVSVACSGIYSLIGFTIFALFIAYITRGRLRNKLFILLSGIPLIIALNIIRITTILGLGYAYGDELALEVFHAVGATVLMFIGTLILLGVTEKIFKKPSPISPCPACGPKLISTSEFCITCGKLLKPPQIKLHRSDFAKICIVFIVAGLLISIQTPVFALTEGPAEIEIQTPSGLQGNTQILPEVSDYTLTYLYRDTSFEDLSGEDASLVYAYGSLNGSEPIWVTVELATSLAPLHRWETCLVTFPISEGNSPKVQTLDLRDVQTQENPPIVARYFAFKYPDNSIQVVLYWYQTARFNVNGTTQVFNVKMSLVEYPDSEADVPEVEAQLLTFATAINEYWQPIRTWATVSLIMSQNGFILSEMACAVLVALIIYGVFLDRRAKISLLQLYGKLSPQDQILITAVKNAQKAHNSSTQGVTAEYGKLTGNPNEYWVERKLAEAEATGLVTKVIANVQDMPVFSWRCQMPRRNALLKWLPF
jgi:exosortase/archaeosortase family protein